MKRVFEKSIVAARSIKENDFIQLSDLTFKKPGNGIPASNFELVVGKRMNVTVTKNHQFTWDDFK